MTTVRPSRKEIIEGLIQDARNFRFCGPGDDPDEISSVTLGYRYLVVQFQRLASRYLPEEFASRLNAISVVRDDLDSAFEAAAEMAALFPEIEDAIEAMDKKEKLGGAVRPQAQLSALFVNHAADILAETNLGLTGPEIVRTCGAFAIEFNVQIPHSAYPFDAPNKRTALAQNLMAFSESQRFLVIRELCDLPSSRSRNTNAARNLKLTLMSRYGHLDAERLRADVNEDLVMQARHWLDSFPEVLMIFNQATEKYRMKLFARNLLDDLRLALEKLVQAILGSDKSLENQVSGIGQFVKARGGSPELSNMFVKLVDYYCKYQNNYVKHDDAVIEEEVEFIIEITAAFLKHFVRLAACGTA